MIKVKSSLVEMVVITALIIPQKRRLKVIAAFFVATFDKSDSSKNTNIAVEFFLKP
jgi:hypothetical protein